MPRIITLLIASTALSSCTTISEIREHPARATYVSASSPAALERCLAGSLSWISLPAIIRGEGSTELSFGSGGGIAVLVTLTPVPEGTRVEARQLITYGHRVRNNVESCVAGNER